MSESEFWIFRIIIFIFNFRQDAGTESEAKTYTVSGDLRDGWDKYTLNATVAAQKLKTIDLSNLKNAEEGTINLGGALTNSNSKSLVVKGTDGNDTFDVTGPLKNGESAEKPNILTLEGGRGNDVYKIGAAATTNVDVTKYVSIKGIKQNDKVTISGATSWAKYTASDLNSEATLKDAITQVLTHNDANVANKVWAFTYKNDTYLIKDTNTALTFTGSESLVKLAGYNIEDLNPYASGDTFTI